jgi:hypothetical protein
MSGKFYIRQTDAEDRNLMGTYVVVNDLNRLDRIFVDRDGNVVGQSHIDKFFATREDAELALIVAQIKGNVT